MPMSASRIAPQSDRPGSMRWPGFSRKKVTLAVASTASAADLSGRPVDARGRVHREHAAAGSGVGVDPLDQSAGIALDVAREPRAKEPVDHASRPVEVDRGGRQDRAGKPGRHGGGVAFERLAPTEEAEVDWIAPFTEKPARDEPVAAVVAGSAKNDDPAARAREPGRLVGDREARRLHQDEAGRSAGDRHAVGLAHFGRGQKVREFQRIEHAGQSGLRPKRRQARKTRVAENGCVPVALRLPGDRRIMRERGGAGMRREPTMALKLVGRDGCGVMIPENAVGMEGRDGRIVAIPTGAIGLQGRDGRMVAVPTGWIALEGSDGRMTPIPAGSIGMQGRDGRMVDIPPGAVGLPGSDGRMVAIPPGKVGVVDRRGRMRAEDPGAPPSERAIRMEADASVDALPDWTQFSF